MAMVNEQFAPVKVEADEVIRNINDLIEDFEFKTGCTLSFETVVRYGKNTVSEGEIAEGKKYHRIDKFDIIVM